MMSSKDDIVVGFFYPRFAKEIRDIEVRRGIGCIACTDMMGAVVDDDGRVGACERSWRFVAWILLVWNNLSESKERTRVCWVCG